MRNWLLTLVVALLPLNAFADNVTCQSQVNAIMRTGVPTQTTPELRAFANVAQSQTDSSIVAAVTGKKIRVLAAVAVTGGTATNLTFNTKPSGAGTAISPLFANAANGGEVLGFNPAGWFETASGEGLTVTTGAGATTGILVTYIAY